MYADLHKYYDSYHHRPKLFPSGPTSSRSSARWRSRRSPTPDYPDWHFGFLLFAFLLFSSPSNRAGVWFHTGFQLLPCRLGARGAAELSSVTFPGRSILVTRTGRSALEIVIGDVSG